MLFVRCDSAAERKKLRLHAAGSSDAVPGGITMKRYNSLLLLLVFISLACNLTNFETDGSPPPPEAAEPAPTEKKVAS